MKNTATTEAPVSVEPEWVRAEKYFEMTGTPVETIRHYRKKGIWLVGKHLATVQNRLHVNIKEADAWIKEQALRRHRA
jgi:hypothetical protein